MPNTSFWLNAFMFGHEEQQAPGRLRQRKTFPFDDHYGDFPDWEWADLDRKRLVWVEKGVLNAARITSKGPVDTKQLHDFNPMTFEALKAPY